MSANATSESRFVRLVRSVARQEARSVSPPVRKFIVVRLKPFTVEALGSSLRLVETDEDFDVGRAVKKEAELGDVCLVSTDENGDQVAHGLV